MTTATLAKRTRRTISVHNQCNRQHTRKALPAITMTALPRDIDAAGAMHWRECPFGLMTNQRDHGFKMQSR